MPNLLLQSCSASKREVGTATPAFDLYTGYFYKILKKAIREEEIRSDVDISILSAKYGLVDRDDEIDYYDQRMDTARAQELNDSVLNEIEKRAEKTDYDRIVVNMGETYRSAITGLSDRVDTPIVAIEGGGIGEKGHRLYEFIRGDDSVVTELNDV
ncbi:DUF6884 domain-containing protein [Halarchaeum salinum]|uniref:DUF6884 domain-containing protein n=1 Tax=Halarchaeum salinum TaxID=489912 RepID=A0AAV3SB32_9EURY